MGTNQPPQDNTLAEKEFPGVLSYGAEGARSHNGGKEGGTVGCGPRRDRMVPAKPLQGEEGGWAERIKPEISHMKTDTHGLGLSGQVTVPKGTVMVGQAEIWALPLLPGAC